MDGSLLTELEQTDRELRLGQGLTTTQSDATTRPLIENGVCCDSFENLSGGDVSSHEISGLIGTHFGTLPRTLAKVPVRP
jgi:hypothetical protein